MENLGYQSVSVVIPTYNRARFVGEAIESALQQGGLVAEVIVVDDGSTDATSDVVGAFGSRVRYIRTENAGASAARNTGARAARTAWVAFLDSDDVWLPGKLESQSQNLSQYPEAIAHFTNVQIERPIVAKTDLVSLRGMQKLFLEYEAKFLERPLAFNLTYNFGRNQSILVRRDKFLTCGLYNEDIRFFEDTDLMNRLALEGPWVISNRVYVREIRREENLNGLGDQHRSNPYLGFEALVGSLTSLLIDDRLHLDERVLVDAKRRDYQMMVVMCHLRAGQLKKVRKALGKIGISAWRLRGWLAFLATFLPSAILKKLISR